tara:strand:- start:773 stop:928 length:156 start_codon:yes stop_codon:yes gene_type:complete
MTDAVSLIYEALQIVYALVPKELLIIILGILIYGYIFNRAEKSIEDKESAK